MSKINWLDTLGWGEDHTEELRYAGYSYLRQGKYDIALSFFKALILFKPENAYDLQTLGAIYIQLNRPAEAMKYFDRALQLEGNHAPTLLNVSKAFFMLNKKDEGLKLAHILKNEKDKYIANVAKALIMAHS
ncbi:MAG: tetratricopeptide repeat protein [Parachlamydiaceae bacterium]|nr:tetratricopeptide repeat protein [Parachlamydiaceae bacterium]